MTDSILTQQHGQILEIALNRLKVYKALNLDVIGTCARKGKPVRSYSVNLGNIIL